MGPVSLDFWATGENGAGWSQQILIGLRCGKVFCNSFSQIEHNFVIEKCGGIRQSICQLMHGVLSFLISVPGPFYTV
jgi:hypothetical protein